MIKSLIFLIVLGIFFVNSRKFSPTFIIDFLRYQPMISCRNTPGYRSHCVCITSHRNCQSYAIPVILAFKKTDNRFENTSMITLYNDDNIVTLTPSLYFISKNLIIITKL